MHAKKLRCFKCKKEFPPDKNIFWCTKCGYSLDIVYDFKGVKELVSEQEFFKAPIRHWKYWPFYPIKEFRKVVSMQEGGTALVKSRKYRDYWLKFEGVNPTGSFKDRGSTVEVSKARELGVKKVLCASTGNMGASISAYCARAGIEAEILVPKFTGSEKIRQIQAYGAKVKKFGATYDAALNETKKRHRKSKAHLAGDYYYRAEGQKSVGFEIMDQMGWSAPENIVCPVGNGTLIFAVYKACRQLLKLGLIDGMPKIFGVQAEGCAPLVEAFESGKKISAVKNPKTLASAIDCGNPVYGLEALEAVGGTGGEMVAVSDKEMTGAMKELAGEGVFSELSGAAPLAAAEKAGLGDSTVLVVSGHGLKESKKYY